MKETMTVKELQDYLRGFSLDLPVFATWEGVYAPILSKNCDLEILDEEDVLVIDVENY